MYKRGDVDPVGVDKPGGGGKSVRRSGWVKPVLLTVAVVALGVLYYIFNPTTSSLAPKCMFKCMTGYDCPGCGSQRLLHALLHGNFADAWHANAYLLCITPLLVVMIYAAMRRARHPRLYAVVNSLPVIALVSISLIVWTIMRNI